MKIQFFKNFHSFSQTFFLVGLPRSGKSTLKNILASAANTEALDEPLDVIAVASNGAGFDPGSTSYVQFMDIYKTLLENHFSELSLGRSYNFRSCDQSFVFNYKQISCVRNAMLRRGRSDVISHAANSPLALILALNDVDLCLEFLCEGAPKPVVVQIANNPISVAREIEKKEWLSDDQLSRNANLLPAYSIVRHHGNKTLYLPYFISENLADLFCSLGNFERSLMYVFLQANRLNMSISRLHNVPFYSVDFSELTHEPTAIGLSLLSKFSLEPTPLTYEIFRKINPYSCYSERLRNLGLDSRLLDLLEKTPFAEKWL
ncbi:MAG: hypothetical protein FJ060_00700 [Cyanobacteria bacterium K_Offshore_0m_m2_072]|nr:hypothetical protein [Cyanobacteria bacterium K_Offshore_0m_m2_072]